MSLLLMSIGIVWALLLLWMGADHLASHVRMITADSCDTPDLRDADCSHCTHESTCDQRP